jgi:glycosyltransferase involved in cell wall biosynthesis
VRVLVLRSCRMPQFEAAVSRVREEHPSARIWALTNEAFADATLKAGADEAIVHSAKKIAITQLGVRLQRRLRRMQFDRVVIPLMEPSLQTAGNLLRLAVVIGGHMTSVCVTSGILQSWTRQQLSQAALTASFSEDVSNLSQMVRAVFYRRRPRPTNPASLRILHIINSLGLGGAQTQLAELINRTPSNHRVDLLLLHSDDEIMRSRILRPGLSVSYLGDLRTKQPGTAIDAIAEFCRQGEYDVVQTWLPVANMIGAAAAKLADVPRIVTSIRSLNPGQYPHCLWWYRIADILSARIADVVTVNASPLVNDHARWAWMDPRRIEVVHNGVDVNAIKQDRGAATEWLREELAVPAGVPLVGCIGRLSEEKDQTTFIRALALLKWRDVPFRAVLAGDGATRAELTNLVGELGLSDVVTFLGARKDARRIMAGLDVLALTSRIEGFPNVLLEAALLGVPVVSTAAGGVIDVIGNADELCVCKDPASVADRLQTMLTNPFERAARALRMMRRAHNQFTAEHMVARWLSLYGPSVMQQEKAA